MCYIKLAACLSVFQCKSYIVSYRIAHKPPEQLKQENHLTSTSCKMWNGRILECFGILNTLREAAESRAADDSNQRSILCSCLQPTHRCRYRLQSFLLPENSQIMSITFRNHNITNEIKDEIWSVYTWVQYISPWTYPPRTFSPFVSATFGHPPFTGGVLVFELYVAPTTDTEYYTLDLVIILSEVNPGAIFENYKWSYLSNLTTTIWPTNK